MWENKNKRSHHSYTSIRYHNVPNHQPDITSPIHTSFLRFRHGPLGSRPRRSPSDSSRGPTCRGSRCDKVLESIGELQIAGPKSWVHFLEALKTWNSYGTVMPYEYVGDDFSVMLRLHCKYVQSFAIAPEVSLAIGHDFVQHIMLEIGQWNEQTSAMATVVCTQFTNKHGDSSCGWP